MSRDGSRLISTKTSRDPNFINLVKTYGTDIGLFYLLLIPATHPDGTIPDSTPSSLKWQIVPGFPQYSQDDIEDMLTILHNNDFIYWDQEENMILFDPKKFYQYQYNIQEDRRRKDHPVRTSVLKRTRRVVSNDAQEKFDEVWRIVPPEYKKGKSWLEHQIKECILQYSPLTSYDLKMCMLGVLEKFDGIRQDLGFLFSNAVRWKWENRETDVPLDAVTIDGFLSEYEKLKKESQLLAAAAGE